MFDFIKDLFDTSPFPQRWMCGNWSQAHGWIHILSDIAIWAAYMTIPMVLIYFVTKRKNIPFPKVFWLFGAFILSCGTGHLIEAGIFYWPMYRLAGALKLITAVTSWLTVFALIPIVPKALAMRSPDELEVEVGERTRELAKTNAKLHEEIEARKTVEAALRESEKRYELLYEHAPDMFVSVDPKDSTVIKCNATVAKKLGYAKPEILGRPVIELYHPDCHAKVREALRQFVTTGAVENEELQLMPKAGGRIDVSLKVSAVRDENGEILYSSSIWRDISARKQAEEKLKSYAARLRESNRDLEQFAYITSHDLKTPLRGIRSLAEWLKSDYARMLDEEGRGMIDRLIDRTARMDDLIEGILAYSRLGRNGSRRHTVDLNRLLLTTIDNLNPPGHIQIEVAEALPEIEGDETRLRQIFQNLIENAINSIDKPSGVVRVSCKGEEEAWMFRIQDNGRGIPEKHQNKIFQMFQTLQPKNAGESTGIGLTLVKKIVSLDGGRIWVDSVPGTGSSFYFTVPK